MEEQENFIIYDSQFEHINDDAEELISDYIKRENKSGKSTIIFEVERTASYSGVTNCNNARDLKYVNRVVETFAKVKQEETGLELLEHGWRSWKSQHNRGRDGWPSNRRWCHSYVRVMCYAIFQKQ